MPAYSTSPSAAAGFNLQSLPPVARDLLLQDVNRATPCLERAERGRTSINGGKHVSDEYVCGFPHLWAKAYKKHGEVYRAIDDLTRLAAELLTATTRRTEDIV